MPLPRISRALRVRIRLQAEIRGASHRFQAETRDISVDGMRLLSPIRMAVGERGGVTLDLPGGFRPTASVEIRWEKPNGATTFLGVQLIHTPETLKAFQKLLWEIESGRVKGITSTTPTRS